MSRTPPSADHSAEGSTLKPLIKGLCLLATLGLAVYLVRWAGLEEMVRDTAWFDAHIRDHGTAGVLLYIGFTAAFTAAGLPRQVACFLGGYAFGFALGTVYATVGSGLGCALAVAYSRFLGRELVARRVARRRDGRLARLDAFLRRSPLRMALIIRFFPLGSNFLTNLAAGVSSIPAAPFILGSTLGYLPQTVVFALFGSGVEVSSAWRMGLGAALFVLSTAMGLALYRSCRAQEACPAMEDSVMEDSGD